MLVPLSWLKNYVPVTDAPQELARRLTMAGVEIGDVDDMGANWDRDKVLVGHVLTVDPHPNADRLRLATVSLGSFLAPEMTFFRSWPGVNFGTAVFLAFIRSPVRGLRTQRASRTFFSNEPKPVMATFSPFATSRVMVSRTDSSAWAAAFLFPSKRAESASMSWVLFTGFPFVQTSVRRARARTSHAR